MLANKIHYEQATKESVLFNLKDNADTSIINQICQDIMMELIDK